MRRRLLLMSAVLLAAMFAVGADWMQFRGPKGSGSSGETGLPATWSSTKNIVWRTKLPGSGTSSPITVGKRVYVTCYSGYGLKQDTVDNGDMGKLMYHLVCVDRDQGAILWTKDFKPTLPEHTSPSYYHGYTSSTPVSDGERLYVFFGKTGVFCLDLNGKEIWRANVGKKVDGTGTAGSPMFYRDLVIINASVESKSLVALNKHTGKEVWRVVGIDQSWALPVLVDAPDGSMELVLNARPNVIGFDPASGKELWRVKGFQAYCAGSPIVHQGVVYVVNQFVMAIRPGGRGDVSKSHVLWRARHKDHNYSISSPVYYDGHLFWIDKAAYCLDAKTGKQVYRKPFGDINYPGFYASALVADGKIYYTSVYDGTFVVAAEPGSGFKQLARNRFEDDDSRTNGSPIVSDGCLLMRSNKYLYCIGRK